ncbi:MAG TPA: transcription elongation factor GreA [bacterium]|jgi:transcription elongation factor GreA|nr:transcription elongation factor GreA [bacterium]
MEDREIPLTRAGLKKLEQELEQRRTIKRREIAERIRQAIEFGDLGENSEYDDAKREQGFNEGRIIELEKLLSKARIIQQSDNNTQVALGSTVTIENTDNKKTRLVTIVGSAEVSPGENKISNNSPVGKALLGQRVGTVVDITVPAGIFHYRIIDIANSPEG